MKRTRIAVRQGVQPAVLVDPIAAATAIFRLQQALVGTQLALDVAGQFQVVAAFLDPAPLLPLLPQFAAGRVLSEDVGRQGRIAGHRYGTAPPIPAGRRGRSQARQAETVLQDLAA